MNNAQLNQLIQQLLDGEISASDLSSLKSEFFSNPQAAKLYLELAQIHSLLGSIEPATSWKTNIVPMEEILRRQKIKSFKVALMSAAAVIILTLITMQSFLVNQAPDLTFTTSQGTQFELSHLDSGEDSLTGNALAIGSRLKLHQGVIQLELKSGVTSVVMAPAEFTLQSENSLSLPEGRAWFYVPREAIGFTVQTNELNIVDLGTEFGVIANTQHSDELHIFTGTVKVTSNNGDSKLLQANQACKTNDSGDIQVSSISPESFLYELPDSLPYYHWSFDEEEINSMIAKGNHPNLGELQLESNSRDLDSFSTQSGKFGNSLTSSDLKALQTNWHEIESDSSRTVAFWVKLSANNPPLTSLLGWGKRVGEDPQTNTRDFYCYAKNESGKTVTGLSLGAYWIEGSTNIGDSQWHHIAYVCTDKNIGYGEPEILYYVDGQIAEHDVYQYNQFDTPIVEGNHTILNTAGKVTDSDPLWLFGDRWGGASEQTPYNRSIDELYIFQGALNTREIWNLFQHNSVLKFPPNNLEPK